MRRRTTLFLSFAAAAALALAIAGFAAAGGGAPRVGALDGSQEVGDGDPDGTGFASIQLNHGQRTVCWEVSFSDIAAPFAAHIHSGPAGVNGPIVVTLDPIAEGCTQAERDLIKDIIQNPDQYYVNVHNSEFPGGAVRGQLSNPGQA